MHDLAIPLLRGTTTRLAVPAAIALFLAGPRPAAAQLFESVGTRAQGMGGAFVAVADDSTATWWNPAGLATGALFSAALERSGAQAPDDAGAFGASMALPSLGVSYYRLRVRAIPPAGSTDQTAAGRQDQAATPFATYVVNYLGATFGQSLGSHVVVASTLRLVHAGDTAGDVDLGAMAKFGDVRVAAVVKHLHEPDLTVDGVRVGLDRQARVGAAYTPSLGRAATLNAAVDADLTTTPTAAGDVRHLAAGAEVWMRRRLGIRAGTSVNTTGATRRSISVGASVAPQSGLFIDGRLTRGDDDALTGWGVDLRLAF